MKLKTLFRRSPVDKPGKIITTEKEREEFFENIEEQLILSDISIDLTDRILKNARAKLGSKFSEEDFFGFFKDEIRSILLTIEKSKSINDSILPLSKLKIDSDNSDSDKKQIIFMVGVNGSGKTTTAAKMAFRFMKNGKKVLLAATDTFRAAGSSQLEKWGEKIGIPVVSDEKGADPGSVLFNALNSFKAKNYDVLIADTAGRVQTRENLMRELEKLVKIVKKFEPKGPSDIFLVVDSTMGQNTVDQAKVFSRFAGITGIILSKIDGTAKGGTILRIADELGIRVRYVGTGEKKNDLEEFSIEDFVESLLGRSKK